MEQKIRIEGIYDQRTLRHLKQKGLRDFCFDFSPRSFNFVQEHVFLEQLLVLLDSSDRIFLHFSRSNDPMVLKLVDDLRKSGQDVGKVYFEFDEWASEMGPLNFGYNYLLNYSKNVDVSKMLGKNFKGFIFDFDFFEDLHRKNILTNFASNFFTSFQLKMSSEGLLLLKVDWHSNLLSSLFDLFEFDLISFPINSKIEICYRNVDLKKLSNEMDILKKNALMFQGL